MRTGRVMTSKKLKKYLAYYQKTLREEPENIEARLRLASIFREMGRIGHAVEEYVNASKLLAREGLPLEAIAACKAVLELEPNHTETQMFLARLFARVPDASGVTARVARPMESDDGQRRSRSQSEGETSGVLATSSVAGEDSQPIELDRPKELGEETSAVDEPSAVDDQTRRADPAELPNFDDIEPPEQADEDEQTRPAELALTGLEEASGDEPDGSTVEMNAADREEIANALRGDVPDEELRTTTDFERSEIEEHERADGEESFDSTLQQVQSVGRDESDEVDYYSDEFRGTQDVSEDDILDSEPVSPDESLRSTQDVPDDAILGEEIADDEDLRATNELDTPRRGTRQLDAASRERNMTSRGVPTAGKSRRPEAEDEETFEVGVFDMDSLGLDNTSTDWDDLSFLDDLDEPETGEVADEFERDTGEFGPAVLRVARSELPRIPLFSKLDPELFTELLRVIDARTFDRGEEIVGRDTDKPSLWVIVSGEASVTKELEDGSVVELARLGEGDFFGEFLLLTGRSGRAKVSAATELSVLEIREEVIEELARSNPEIWDILWDFYYSRMLNNMLATSVIFRSLDKEQRQSLADEFTLEEIPSGERLLGQGDSDDDLYLICNGAIRVEHEDRDGNTREIDTLREGEFVGLISSAEEKPVVANLHAIEDCTLLVLPGAVFRTFMNEHPSVAREVDRAVRERKATAGRYTSGVTSYAELGIAKPGHGRRDD